MNPHAGAEFYARIDLLQLFTAAAYNLRGMTQRSDYAKGYWDAISCMALSVGVQPWQILQAARMAEDNARSMVGLPLLYEGREP